MVDEIRIFGNVTQATESARNIRPDSRVLLRYSRYGLDAFVVVAAPANEKEIKKEVDQWFEKRRYG